MTRRLFLVLCAVASLTGPAAAGSAIVVRDAWSRPAARTAVMYAVLQNRGPRADRLIGATSTVARQIELHRTSSGASAMPAMDGMPMDGAMTSMRPLASISIAAHRTTILAPGGYHLMLDLRREIKPGETIPLRLHFARAGWIDTVLRVRPIR